MASTNTKKLIKWCDLFRKLHGRGPSVEDLRKVMEGK